MTPPEGFPQDCPLSFPQQVTVEYEAEDGLWVVSGNGALLCVTPHYWLAESVNIMLAATEAQIMLIQPLLGRGIEAHSARGNPASASASRWQRNPS